MAIVSDVFPNLINGVSQQAPAIRLSSQLEECVNGNASVVHGLHKRQPTQTISKLTDADYSGAFVHPINRDSTEQYIVTIIDDTLKVFNLDGVEMTLTTPDGTSYLNIAGTPKNAFRAVTIADTTFILNREKTAAMSGSTTAVQVYEALIWIKQGIVGHQYKVNIDGVDRADYASATSDPLTKSTTVAEELYNDLVASIGSGGTNTFQFTLSENMIYVKRVNSADFKIRVWDSYGNTASSVIKGSVQMFDELPAKAYPDMVMKVNGSDNSDTAYWVKFVPDNAATFGKGQWSEVPAPGVTYTFDNTTMPHKLVRTGTNTFVFQKVTWADRTAGNATSAPAPSFIGQRINDVFVYRGRLGFLAGENVILSQASGFLNFWPTTSTTILDDDRIDYKLGGVAVAFLYHAIPFLDHLVLFSDQSQLTLTHGDTLTQKTVAATVTTFFDGQSNVRPINAGSSLLFTFVRGSGTGVREYFSDQATKVNDAAEITAHCPNYIEDAAVQLAASTTLNMATILTTDSRLWVYQWLWNNNEKVQSAWHKWTFDAPPVSSFFIADVLYLLLQREDGLWLEKIELSKTVDDASSYIVHLDRRITVTRDSYDADTNESTFTLPYYSEDVEAVADATLLTLNDNDEEGDGTSTVIVSGDVEESVFGIPYTFEATLSKPFIKQNTPQGGSVAVDGSRFQVKRYDIRYSKSGYFTVEVTPDSYNTFTYPFSGRLLGAQGNVLGSVPLDSGVLHVPIRAKNEDVQCVLKNDSFMPSAFLSVEWIGDFNPKAKRI